jgi:HSP20 family protein
MATEGKEPQAVERRRRGAALSPFEEMERAFERLFPRGWPRLWRWEWPPWPEFGPFGGRMPRVDVIDRENEVVLRAEVPGLNKEDLEVTVTDDAVTIRGEVKRPEEEAGDYSYHELSAGPFSRTIALPATVDPDRAKVRLRNGLLEMTLPKVEAEKRRKIVVEEG